MKKKLVNVVLSVAVVTSMMFAVTACGSNNSTQDAAVTSENNASPASAADEAPEAQSSVAELTEEQSSAAESTEAESSATEEESSAAESEEAGDVTLDDWISSDDAVAAVEYMNTSLDGMTVSFEADGDVFSMVFTMDEVIEIADDAEETMKALFDGQSSLFESVREELIDETGNENIIVRIAYINGDGTELYSQEF